MKKTVLATLNSGLQAKELETLWISQWGKNQSACATGASGEHCGQLMRDCSGVEMTEEKQAQFGKCVACHQLGSGDCVQTPECQLMCSFFSQGLAEVNRAVWDNCEEAKQARLSLKGSQEMWCAPSVDCTSGGNQFSCFSKMMQCAGVSYQDLSISEECTECVWDKSSEQCQAECGASCVSLEAVYLESKKPLWDNCDSSFMENIAFSYKWTCAFECDNPFDTTGTMCMSAATRCASMSTKQTQDEQNEATDKCFPQDWSQERNCHQYCENIKSIAGELSRPVWKGCPYVDENLQHYTSTVDSFCGR